jgi:hypothetical protein
MIPEKYITYLGYATLSVLILYIMNKLLFLNNTIMLNVLGTTEGYENDVVNSSVGSMGAKDKEKIKNKLIKVINLL